MPTVSSSRANALCALVKGGAPPCPRHSENTVDVGDPKLPASLRLSETLSNHHALDQSIDNTKPCAARSCYDKLLILQCIGRLSWASSADRIPATATAPVP